MEQRRHYVGIVWLGGKAICRRGRGTWDALLRRQMVTDSGGGEAAEWRPLPLELRLERETRVELATPAARRGVLCLGSTG